MPTVQVESSAAVYVNGQNATTQKKNYSSQATFRVGTSPQVISYLYFSRPFPVGARIISARLEITQSQPNTGTRNITAQRTAANWVLSKITHNNRPGVTGAAASTSIGSGARGRVITLDVTAQMADVSAGAPWYGLRIYTDGAATMHFFKSGEFAPRLIVEYSTAPTKPVNLVPSGGRAISVDDPTLTFGYSSDDAGAMTAVHIQANKTVADFATPSIDVGPVAWTIPTLYWDPLQFPLNVGETWFWRARVRNDSNEWSDWSDPAEFTLVLKSALTITAPTGSPAVVTDPTPPFGWSFTGTQEIYRVVVRRISDGATMWDTREIAGNATSVVYPDNAPNLERDTDYRLTVRVWDDVDRAVTTGDPAYVEESVDFRYEFDASVPAATSLQAATTDGDPRVTLTWTRSQAPDEWIIIRDGKAVKRIAGPDASDGGTNYKCVDLTAGGGSHTWEVAAVVNGVTSASNPTATASTHVVGVWLMTLDGEHAVNLTGGVPHLEAQELSTVHLPLGAKNPVLITQTILGRRGRAKLALDKYSGRTVADELECWTAINDRDQYPRGTTMQLAWTDLSLPVFIFNTVRDARDEQFGVIPVSFEFCEIQ